MKGGIDLKKKLFMKKFDAFMIISLHFQILDNLVTYFILF